MARGWSGVRALERVLVHSYKGDASLLQPSVGLGMHTVAWMQEGEACSRFALV